MVLTQQDFNEIEKIIKESLEDRMKYLLNKDEFFEQMDKVMGELKAIRKNQEMFTNKEYGDH